MSGHPYSDLEDVKVWARAKMQRPADFIIGDPENPYMRRWWIVPRNEHCNVYLHEILRSDDDRAGHDHPWDSTSFIIDGGYEEVVYLHAKPWEAWDSYPRVAGDTVHRKATDTHRLIVTDDQRCISLFTTGPKLREWGFWCPDGRGWVNWRDFTGGPNGELIGKGCGS